MSSEHGLAGENHANCGEMFFYANKCKCMSQNVGMKMPIREGSACFSMLNFKSRPVLK